jgi:hypothetical protein
LKSNAEHAEHAEMETSSDSFFFVFGLRVVPDAVLVSPPRATAYPPSLGVLGVLGV